jgi:hypothetical protein
MKLSELESMKLLPRFAEGYEFACDALDEWMKQRVSFKDALESPWTLEGIAALSEDDLQAAYKIYSTADYYPDLPRADRNRFLFEQIVNIRKLGTIEAVKALMRYIYPGMSVTIDDTIAFDENGNVIDSTLLHCYEVRINLDLTQLPNYVMSRVTDNIRRFMRATAALHSILYEAGVEIPIHPVPINGEQAVMSEVVESCKGDVDAWGLYGFTPIEYEDGSAGSVFLIIRAIRMSRTEISSWTLQEAKRFADVVDVQDAAATSSVVQRTSDILFPHDVIKQIVGAMYNVDADGSEVFRRVRDGQFGIYKNAPNITEIEHLYRSDFAVHPTILFVLIHPSRTPYNAGAYTFTQAGRSDAPILWKIDERVAYKGVDFPNGAIFGIKQSSASLAFGEACKDMIVNYVSDGFLRCQTTNTLYANVQYFVFAYYTEDANAVEVPIRRISDDAQFRAYTTPDNYYFILDENYETNTWIPESELQPHGYYI